MEFSKQVEENFKKTHENAQKLSRKSREFHEEFMAKMRDEGGYIDIPRVHSLRELKDLIEKDNKKMKYTDKMGKQFATVNYTFIIEEIIRRAGYIDQLCLKVLMDLNYEQFTR